MQRNIRVAWKSNQKSEALKLQQNLINSWRARALAVRIVTTNKGKKTPGVDKVIWDTPQDKWKAIQRLSIRRKDYNCLPVRRVYIKKPNGGLRP